MSPEGYTEDRLVERPAIELFQALGWAAVSALDEALGATGVLGRETKSEVVLIPKTPCSIGAVESTFAFRRNRIRDYRACT